MNEAEVFVLADRALAAVVSRIRPEQWDMTMPANFAMRGGGGPPTLRSIVNYHAYDDAWVPDMLAGRTMEEAGAAKFDGDLLGDDPLGRFEAIVADACAAASAVTDLDAVAHLSFGDFTVREYFWQINSFRALRAHDIARALGVDPGLVTRAGAGDLGRGEPPCRGVAHHRRLPGRRRGARGRPLAGPPARPHGPGARRRLSTEPSGARAPAAFRRAGPPTRRAARA